jgi:hypothetical protein
MAAPDSAKLLAYYQQVAPAFRFAQGAPELRTVEQPEQSRVLAGLRVALRFGRALAVKLR